MSQITTDQKQNRMLREGVFQPGRAEIAREMKSRLILRGQHWAPRIEPLPEVFRSPVFSG